MNIIVRKAQFLDVGGFNESLITCEDVDFCYRISKFGKILSDSNTPLQDSSGISGQSASSQAPSFNLVRGTGENQLLEGITQQQEPIRAYVLSDEVRTASAADRNASSEASLG